MKATVIPIIRDIGVFVRVNARSCVSERICDVFLIKIVFYIQECIKFPDDFFLKLIMPTD